MSAKNFLSGLERFLEILLEKFKIPVLKRKYLM